MNEKPADYAPVEEQNETRLRAVDDEQLGQEIAHTFRLEKCLGRGGMGVVFQARHLILNKLVALKLLNQTAAGAPGVVERFRREAVAISSLDHLNIVRLNSFDVDENDQAFLVMDLVEGQSLSELIKEKGKLPPKQALCIASQVLAALAHAHSHHIIHRDIKPANIMVVPKEDGSLLVKVVDFGLAKILGPADGHSQNLSLTKSGEMLGSPLYMSPEQCTGDPLDERSDVYSTGCVLYEMLTGQPPFSADNFLKILHLHATASHKVVSDMDIPSKIETALNDVLNMAMAKRLESRFQSASAMRNATEGVLRSDWLIKPPVQATAAATDGLQEETQGNLLPMAGNERRSMFRGMVGLVSISILAAFAVGVTAYDFLELGQHLTSHPVSKIVAGKKVDPKIFDLENLSVIDPRTTGTIYFKESMQAVVPMPELLSYGQTPEPYTRDDSTIDGGIANVIPSDQYFRSRMQVLSKLNGRSFSGLNAAPLIKAADWFYDCGDMGRALCYYQKLFNYAELNGNEKAQIHAKLGDCYMYFNLFGTAGREYLAALARLNEAVDEPDIFLLSQVELKLAYCQKTAKTLPDADFALNAYHTRLKHQAEIAGGIENQVTLGDINLMRGAPADAVVNYDNAVERDDLNFSIAPRHVGLDPFYASLIELRKAKAYLALHQPDHALQAMSRAQANVKSLIEPDFSNRTTDPPKQTKALLPRIYYTIGLANEQMHKQNLKDWSAYDRALENFNLALTTTVAADPAARKSAFAEMCLAKLSEMAPEYKVTYADGVHKAADEYRQVAAARSLRSILPPSVLQ